MAIHPRTPTPRYQRPPYPRTRVAAHQYRREGQPVSSYPSSIRGYFDLTPQGQAVCDWGVEGTGSAFVEAVAGAGKTTLLFAFCEHVHKSQPRATIAMLAFARKNADENIARLKAAGMDTYVTANGFHSFGFRAWREFTGCNPRVSESDKRKMMLDECQVPAKFWAAVGKLVSLGKQSGVCLIWDIDNLVEWRRVINHYDVLLSVKENGLSEEQTILELVRYTTLCLAWSRRIGRELIDFDDMLWLPLIEQAPFPQYDWFLGDEFQDTNPVRRLIAHRMIKPGGRGLFVGDRYQSIFGFTGADAAAVELVISEFDCRLFPLTTSFRCSKTATRLAQEYVPQIEAADTNAEGTVSDLTHDGLLSSLPQPGSAILCRNTKPLVELAFTLIKEGVGCHVEGRDIGKGLERLATKWKSITRVADLLRKLEEYRYREIQKLSENGFQENSYAIDSLNDRIDCLIAVSDGCYTVDDILRKIERIFQDTDPSGARKTVTLSTIHKAKGREWEVVYQLGFDALLPSRHARQPWQRDQERNLQYVAITRTKRDTVFLAMQERERTGGNR